VTSTLEAGRRKIPKRFSETLSSAWIVVKTFVQNILVTGSSRLRGQM